MKCRRCEGRGYKHHILCDRCGGTGQVTLLTAWFRPLWGNVIWPVIDVMQQAVQWAIVGAVVISALAVVILGAAALYKYLFL